MAESLETRLARLERELAFLKAQGLSREEQSSLMDRPPRHQSRKTPLWARSLLILNIVLILAVGWFIFMLWPENAKDKEALERPKRSESFALPGAPKPR